jgi:acetyl esterase/lipase
VHYGTDHQQYADLRRPHGRARGTVVLLHGGYWQAAFGAALMTPMAERLTEQGYVTWNVEYRRVGTGGGYPATLEDVATAIDHLEAQHLPPAMVVGHSAGGHLAVWAASRTARTPGGAPRVALRSAVSLSGVLDLTTAALEPGPSAPTIAFMGGTPDQAPGRYAVADPRLLVPATCPVTACQADRDQVVPPDQARRYVAADTAAGGHATFRSLRGDHFAIIDPREPSYPIVSGLVDEAFSRD